MFASERLTPAVGRNWVLTSFCVGKGPALVWDWVDGVQPVWN